MMMEHDIELARREIHLRNGGHKTKNSFEEI
jgi:hypothetical protein